MPYFKLALQWAYSLCSSGTRRCSPTHPFASIPPPQYRFTIHGLWPDIHPRQGNSAPKNFRNIPYTPIQEKNQLARMEYYWPNAETKGANVMFWTGQWMKHGTCAEPQLTQEQFFNKALDLVNRLNLDTILNAGGRGVKPGRNFGYASANANPNANVTFLLQQSLGVLPEVVCDIKKQLAEVRVCYDYPRDSWINCPNPTNSCPNPYQLPL